jgi:hypothetical protein
MSIDAGLDEIEHNIGITGGDPATEVKLVKFRMEIDELCDGWDEKIRAAKTAREADRDTSAMTKAIQEKYTELLDQMKAELRQAQDKMKQPKSEQSGITKIGN